MASGSAASEENTRAGVHHLLFASDPINRRIMRKAMRNRRIFSPMGAMYELGSEGREGAFIGAVVEDWLRHRPEGGVELESRHGQRAIAALAQGWATTVIHALAREPLTARELLRQIDDVRRGALRRQLTAMHELDLIEAHSGGDDSARYALTDWGRAGVAPLMAAARLERRNPAEVSRPIDPLDVEATFLITLPMLELSEELTGTCRFGVNLVHDDGSGTTGVTAEIELGQVTSCEPGLKREVDAWAVGTAEDWLGAVIEGDTKRVRAGGDRWLAEAVLRELHRSLFRGGPRF